MKLNASNLLWIAIPLLIVMIAGIFFASKENRALRAQVKDLSVQLAHANIEMIPDTIRDSIPVITQLVVEVDKTDYKKQIADRELISDLKLKVSQIESENTMLRETLGKVQLQLEKKDSLELFTYHDKWADFEVDLQTKQLEYAVRDSLVTFVTIVYKHKFLWWRWGKKGCEVKIVNFNPRSEVLYNKSIMIK